MPTTSLGDLNVIPQSVLDSFCKLSLHERHNVLQACGLDFRFQHESSLSYFQRCLKDIIRMNLVNSFIDELSIECETKGRS